MKNGFFVSTIATLLFIPLLTHDRASFCCADAAILQNSCAKKWQSLHRGLLVGNVDFLQKRQESFDTELFHILLWVKDENGTWRCSNGIFKHEKCFRYFVTNCYFSPINSPFKNYERCFLFYLKSSFRSWDIQIFKFPSSPFFLSVSHFFRAWSKINLEVYEVIICLSKDFTLCFAMSKNGQTHFKNFAAFAARFLKCAWSFYNIAK